MSEEGARPQDVGRPHRRRLGEVSPEVASILERYRGAMRDELGDVLEELRPDKVQTVMIGGDVRLKPALADRLRLWDLAIKLGRELNAPGAEEPPPDLPAPTGRRPARAPRLSARDRKALGG